jgi:hypothetical protein
LNSEVSHKALDISLLKERRIRNVRFLLCLDSTHITHNILTQQAGQRSFAVLAVAVASQKLPLANKVASSAPGARLEGNLHILQRKPSVITNQSL